MHMVPAKADTEKFRYKKLITKDKQKLNFECEICVTSTLKVQ